MARRRESRHRSSAESLGGGSGHSKPISLGKLLGEAKTLRSSSAVGADAWRAAVGDRIAARAQAAELERETLTVNVASSTWSQELSLLSETIVERLRERGVRVRRLRFRLKAPEAPARDWSLPCAVVPVTKAPLPEELATRLEQVEDPALRSAIAEAASRWLGRRERASARGARGPRSVAAESAPPGPAPTGGPRRHRRGNDSG